MVAEFGVIIPFFKGEKYHPQLPPGVPKEQNAPNGAKYNWPGFKVQHVDMKNGTFHDMIYNKSNLPASAQKGTGGLERPIQMEWGPDGSLYIVDFGVVNSADTGMDAQPLPGWCGGSEKNKRISQ